MLSEQLTEQIIGAAIEVHKQLGAGLLESSYERCLCRELELRGVPYECEVGLPIEYKGITLDAGYRIDLIVAGEVMLRSKPSKNSSPSTKHNC